MRDDLLRPTRLFSRDDVLAKPTPVPAVAGIYAWYFDAAPGPAPLEGAHAWMDHRLLYVGIAPRRPTPGAAPTRRSLAVRLREHFNLNAEGSTLRLTLGCLLGLELRRIASRKRPGTARRMTFGRDGEAQLNAWMAAHARVVWHPDPEPWIIEEQMLERMVLPLNLDANRHGAFHAQLSAIRAEARARARALPPLVS
jgi:hypothetical protein